MLHDIFVFPILSGMDNEHLKSRTSRRLNNRRLAEVTGQTPGTISEKLRGREGYPLAGREAFPIAVAEIVSDEDWEAIATRFSEIVDEFSTD